MKIPHDMHQGFVHKTKNGNIKVIKYYNRNKVDVEFVPSGFRTSAKSQAVREGRIMDRLSPTVLGVAMIGDGPYKNTINYKTTAEYKCWVCMIYRCYSPNDSSYSRYGGRGVTVCEEWLNFQNFARWYHDNYPSGGDKYQIDKDILVDGNLIYSPETCKFVSPQENTEKAHAQTFKMISPSGEVVEIYNMKKFCRENGLSPSHMWSAYHEKKGRLQHKGWRKFKG